MSVRPYSRAILACSTAVLLGHCKKPAPAGTSAAGALAVVAGQPVTERDLLQEAEWRRANRQAVPPAPELLREMVDRLALVEKAKQAGLADDFETRRQIQSVIIARLRSRDIDTALAAIEVTPEEIAAAYESRREEFARKGLDRFAILFQAADEKASQARRAESRERLEDAIALVDANPAAGGRGPAAGGFGQVAIDHSEDQSSRYRGGDIGWIETGATETRWPAEVIAAGRALEKGERSGVLEGPEGFYLIMKTDSRPGGERPLEEVADGIRRELLRDKRKTAEVAFLEDARKLSNAAIDADAAAKVSLPDAATPEPSSDLPAPELSAP